MNALENIKRTYGLTFSEIIEQEFLSDPIGTMKVLAQFNVKETRVTGKIEHDGKIEHVGLSATDDFLGRVASEGSDRPLQEPRPN